MGNNNTIIVFVGKLMSSDIHDLGSESLMASLEVSQGSQSRRMGETKE